MFTSQKTSMEVSLVTTVIMKVIIYLESRGFAFVRFYDKRDAEDAIEGMDGKDLDGRELRVDIARHDRPQPCKKHSLRL